MKSPAVPGGDALHHNWSWASLPGSARWPSASGPGKEGGFCFYKFCVSGASRKDFIVTRASRWPLPCAPVTRLCPPLVTTTLGWEPALCSRFPRRPISGPEVPMSLRTHCAELCVDHFPVLLHQSAGPAGEAKYYSILVNKESGVLCQKTQGRILPRPALSLTLSC